MASILQNLKYKIFGDRRDQRQAVRAAGFEDERAAAAWADEVVAGMAEANPSQVEVIAALRQADPRLTLATATHLARQRQVRSSGA